MNMPAKTVFFLVVLSLISRLAQAQLIHGEVLEIDSNVPLEGAVIENIYTNITMNTPKDGSFVIAASPGQMLVFKKPGYKQARVRIPNGFVPPFFRIILERGYTPPTDAYAANGDRYDYRRDSLRYYELYKHELEFAKMSTIEKIKSPFSAMSARNREIWQFQDDYKEFEEDKYIDRTFNRDLVTKITGLKGDSLTTYMRRYRPSYEQLHGMNDYTYFSYIKNTVRRFRGRDRPAESR